MLKKNNALFEILTHPKNYAPITTLVTKLKHDSTLSIQSSLNQTKIHASLPKKNNNISSTPISSFPQIKIKKLDKTYGFAKLFFKKNEFDFQKMQNIEENICIKNTGK